MGWETALLVILGLIDLGILAWIVGARVHSRGREERRRWVRHFMRAALPSAPVAEVVRAFQRDPVSFMTEYMELVDSVELPGDQSRKVQLALVEAHHFPRLMRGLQSRSAASRARSAVWLSYAAPEQALRPLVAALERERRRSVCIHLAHALTRLGHPVVIPTLVDTLAGSDEAYQARIYGLLCRLGTDFHDFFPILRNRTEPEIRALLSRVAADRGDADGRDYLLELMEGAGRELAVEATRLLLQSYVHSVDTSALLASDDPMVVNLTLEAMGRLRPQVSLEPLLEAVRDSSVRKSAVVGLSHLVHDRPQTYTRIIDEVAAGGEPGRLEALLEVLSNRVEYLVEQILREPDSPRSAVLDLLVRSGRTGGLISFLNKNRDPAAEERIALTIRPAIRDAHEVADQFAVYAKPDFCRLLGIEQREVQQTRGSRMGESIQPLFIVGIIIATVIAPVIVYGAGRMVSTNAVPGLSWSPDYVRAFTRFFGYYAFTLNLIYLLLLGFAAAAVHRQQASLRIKPLTMLFSPQMLPSISIVAPAYNEEATIVESVNSLLNLRYPDFEIIVVNDGSPDGTLQRLTESFELERVDIFLHNYLQTQPVRGVYRNPRIPELTVIDKQNGGKADSLNVGINASRKTYFAAIDADSLLERDSLLRLAARFLDTEVPVVATGGNILPVNGCAVSHGKLDEIRLPREVLGRFQALEYVRSFMAGRTGWAGINSLMIISGAFGLFRKKDVVDAHGYLTGSGFYAKDTVAEDMELVVRIARSLRDRGERFAIQYGYNANCWTEVPISHRILRNQRDRWQRGLIDTMFYHIRMLGNPRYGTIGTVGFPYFFVFELLGPWVEIQGLLFLIVGLGLGLLTPGIVMLVLAATVPLGVAVSLSSLLLAEHHQHYFQRRDRLVFVLFAVLENLGYRQYASLLRLRGYLSALTRKTGWGTMTRTGFSKTKQSQG